MIWILNQISNYLNFQSSDCCSTFHWQLDGVDDVDVDVDVDEVDVDDVDVDIDDLLLCLHVDVLIRLN